MRVLARPVCARYNCDICGMTHQAFCKFAALVRPEPCHLRRCLDCNDNDGDGDDASRKRSAAAGQKGGPDKRKKGPTQLASLTVAGGDIRDTRM